MKPFFLPTDSVELTRVGGSSCIPLLVDALQFINNKEEEDESCCWRRNDSTVHIYIKWRWRVEREREREQEERLV